MVKTRRILVGPGPGKDFHHLNKPVGYNAIQEFPNKGTEPGTLAIYW